MRTLINLLVKELLQLKRDPKLLPILFVAPVFQLMVLGYAATTDVRQVELAVCDLDHSQASRVLIDDFTASTYFRLVAQVEDQRELDPLLQSGSVRIALTIPAGFAADRAAGRTATVQLTADGSDAMTGTTGLAYAQGVLAAAGARTVGSRAIWNSCPRCSTTRTSSAGTSWSRESWP
jgi:ABC-2 type transport system permease protein